MQILSIDIYIKSKEIVNNTIRIGTLYANRERSEKFSMKIQEIHNILKIS